jgi:MFS family permease
MTFLTNIYQSLTGQDLIIFALTIFWIFYGYFNLKGSPKELGIIYLTKVLEIIAYGLMSSTLVLWLSQDLGFSDTKAGALISVWSTIITLITILVGSLTDSIGIKRSFLLGFGLCLISRFVMSQTVNLFVVLPFGLFLLAMGLAMMTPVMTAAVKAYASAKNRTLAFSLFYTFMNIGFAISGVMFDNIRKSMGEAGVTRFLGQDYSTYRYMFILAFLFTIPGFLITFFGLRDGVSVDEKGNIEINPTTLQQTEDQNQSMINKMIALVKNTASDTVVKFTNVMKQPSFHKFLLILTLLVGVRLVFYHMHYTFPKFAIRELGQGAPIGQLWGVLNPVLIILLVPLVGSFSSKISSYTMMFVGTTICTISLCFLVMPLDWFAGLANGSLGHFIANTWLQMNVKEVSPWYISITFFTVLMSIGEAIWSPRLYEYTASIAPKGQEATYMSLSMLPFFVAKFGVGLLSGALLSWYVPETGERNSQMLWLWVTLMAAICPIGLFFGRKFLKTTEEGRA